MKQFYILCFSILLTQIALAQQDSIKSKKLEEVIIKSHRIFDMERLPALQATYLWSGKKNEVINVQNIDANIAERTPRQIFAKVPGVFVYDMDGTGNQMNISTRGLDPHRGWEFNNRTNGVLTNSDMYGYPASHYSIPMEAVERIQLVRGTGSLQYGAQFGGMLNYITKRPDSTKAFSFETVNSGGSFGLLSTYNAVSGRIGKVEYYVYVNKRVSEGYRDNSRSDYGAESVMISYSPTANLKLKAELGHTHYVYQFPGPLTDSMFLTNPRQSTRARNYFNPDIFIPSFSLDWKLGNKTRLVLTTSAVLGSRNSVQFDRPATVADAIDPITLQYAARQVDIDHFNSYTTEVRLLHRYTLLQYQSSFVAGVQIMNNDLHRQQLGKGTTGSDFDLSLSQPGFGRDLHFKTKNFAAFIENNFRVSSKLSINPGVRVELGQSDMTGTINYYDPGQVPNTIKHNFPLLGVNAEYQLTGNSNFYGGWSQAYRPVIFKDIIPASVYEKSDKNLKDAYGYNLEAGFRGSTRSLQWDVGLFQLQYNNRLGVLSEKDANGNFYLLHTNIGNSLTQGLELFAEYALPISNQVSFSVFTSTAFMNARYTAGAVRSGENNIDIRGNNVESAPSVITRNGLNIKFNKSSFSLLYSYTGKSYADALNTKTPSANGAVGLVPSYGLLDINASFKLSDRLTARLNINNVTDKHYFTKRPTFYPGPGVWSSDGRSFVVSVGIRI